MKTAIANEDKEIRNYFADIVIPIPSDYDEFIQERISHASALNASGEASPRKILRLKRTIMLVAVIIVLIVGSITVAASIGAYNERMSKLSDEDKQTLVDNADKIKKEGYTIVPLELFLSHGFAKIEIGLAKGKKLYDKREAISKKSQDRDIARQMKR